jgi:hypothetical protein
MNQVDRFLKILEGKPLKEQVPVEELLAPLHDLAVALRGHGIGAGVLLRTSVGDVPRYHLEVWPLYRPAMTQRVWTVHVSDAPYVTNAFTCLLTFRTPDKLASWLETSVGEETFSNLLTYLYHQAREPVEARLERKNGMATLVIVPPNIQRELGERQPWHVFDLSLRLPIGEPAPDGSKLRYLRSAGIDLQIVPDTVEVTVRSPRSDDDDPIAIRPAADVTVRFHAIRMRSKP